MNRKLFDGQVVDNLVPIICDEVRYFKENNPEINLYIPLLSELLLKYSIEEIANLEFDDLLAKTKSEIGYIYYNFDLHKVRCKTYFEMQNIKLDRHKIATMLMFAVLDYEPVRLIGRANESINEDILLMNYRIAFRFALSYAAKSLFNSFNYKITINEQLISEKNFAKKSEEQCRKTIKEYETAMSKLMIHNTLLLPQTRDELESYDENYIKALYLQLRRLRRQDIIPYMLISDTFYWIDVYTKLQLGVTVEPQFNGYDYGLKRLH